MTDNTEDELRALAHSLFGADYADQQPVDIAEPVTATTHTVASEGGNPPTSINADAHVRNFAARLLGDADFNLAPDLPE